MAEDFTKQLAALRQIATLLGNKEEPQANLWAVAELERGSNLKKVNAKIKFIKELISAHNKATNEDEGEQDDSPRRDHVWFQNEFKPNRKIVESEVSLGKAKDRKSQGRDKKMLLMSSQMGDQDMKCDRMYAGDDGEFHVMRHDR